MKRLRQLLALLSLSVLSTAALVAATGEPKPGSPKNCGCKCCVGKDVCCCHAEEVATSTPPTAATAPKPAPAPESAASAGHPLVGVIVDVMPDRQALLVKHEEIPGVMRAMTMLLRVDEAGLKAAVKGAPVTGLLVRREKIWWLDAVKVTASK